MRSDKEIWKEKFKNGDTIKDFTVEPGPGLELPKNEDDKKSIIENIKFWNKKKVEKTTLEKRVEDLEKEMVKIKKYLNHIARTSKSKNQSPDMSQNNRGSNETQSQ